MSFHVFESTMAETARHMLLLTVSPRPSHGGDHVPRIPRPDKERRERAVAWFGVVAILTIAG